MRRCAYCRQVEGDHTARCPGNPEPGGGHYFEGVAAIVEPVTRDHIVLSLSPGYTAVSFKLANGGAEIVILDKHSTETTRLAVAPPAAGHTLIINNTEAGVEVIYERMN